MVLERFVDMTRCLLIDHDSAERRRLEQLLAGLGVETAFSAKADEALQYCNDNSPDVVMLAAAAPGVAPRDLVKRLQRSAKGRPPVVFLYAETPDTAVFGQSILEGAADVLMMPFDRDLLQFKLRQAGVIS
jgi:CheY-like chemotaxis protein